MCEGDRRDWKTTHADESLVDEDDDIGRHPLSQEVLYHSTAEELVTEERVADALGIAVFGGAMLSSPRRRRGNNMHLLPVQ